MSPEDLSAIEPADLQQRLHDLELEMVPLQARVAELRLAAEVLRTEQRRRERLALLETRRATRTAIGGGGMPTLEDVVSGADASLDGSLTLTALRFLRESATEVGIGYASAPQPALTFTDGRAIQEANDLDTARRLWAEGWEFGTPAARGVRVYPIGSRAERMVPAAEVHVQVR